MIETRDNTPHLFTNDVGEQLYSANEFRFTFTTALVGNGCHYALATEISRACIWLACHGVKLNTIVTHYLDNSARHNAANSLVNQALRAADTLQVKSESIYFERIDNILVLTGLLAVNNIPPVMLPDQKLFLHQEKLYSYQPLSAFLSLQEPQDILLMPIEHAQEHSTMLNTPLVSNQKEQLYHQGLPLKVSVWHTLWVSFSRTLAPVSAESALQAGSKQSDQD